VVPFGLATSLESQAPRNVARIMSLSTDANLFLVLGDGTNSVAVGDVNGDGNLDVVTSNLVNLARSSVSVVLGDGGKTIQSARVALAAVAPTPLFVQAAGRALAGRDVSEEAIEGAAQAAMAAARPINDMRGTIEQRRHLVGVLTRRTLRGAIQRAREA
jgi:carbon-monoxide dehydrogenase medium subunit